MVVTEASAANTIAPQIFIFAARKLILNWCAGPECSFKSPPYGIIQIFLNTDDFLIL